MKLNGFGTTKWKKKKNTASIFEKLITMVEQPCDFVAITVTWFNDLRRNGGITDVCLPASGDKINIFSHTPEISEDTENVCYICRVKKANWGLLKVHLKDTWRTAQLHTGRSWQTCGSERILEAHSSPRPLERCGWSPTAVEGVLSTVIIPRPGCLTDSTACMQRVSLLSSPSAGGGSVDELTPVTWAATLGRGTPRTPGLRTGSTPVSLSVRVRTRHVFFYRKKTHPLWLAMLDSQWRALCSPLIAVDISFWNLSAIVWRRRRSEWTRSRAKELVLFS